MRKVCGILLHGQYAGPSISRAGWASVRGVGILVQGQYAGPSICTLVALPSGGLKCVRGAGTACGP